MAKAKKVKLPFVVEPKRQPIMELVGSEESGKIEIERRGYLTVAEKTFVQQAMGGDTPVVALHRLAAKVARKSGKQASEVVELFGEGDLGNPIFESFGDELTEVMGTMQSYEARRKLAAATALLMYRFDTNWGVESTMELHPDLLEGLFDLYIKEEIGSLEGFESEEIASEEQETEGK